MINNPKISIITICYNSEDVIEETIKSVLAQDYANIEYIIIDGGSTDNTLSIIEKYRSEIGVLISESDNGISDAFNKGIKGATGEIIGIVNAGDRIASCDVVGRIATYYTDDTDIYRGREILINTDTGYSLEIRPSMKLLRNPSNFRTCHMATYIKRSCFEKYGYYNIDFKYCMDTELVYRLLSSGAHQKEMEFVIGEFSLGGISQKMRMQKRKELAYISRYVDDKFYLRIYIMFYSFIKDLTKSALNSINPDLARKIRGAREKYENSI